ncbi:putative beta-1,4-mannosyltransferase [Phyllosticta citriasiana]|uniref:Chitobiosyldiphosphodolichol beta-mannosyltransferase n=1 Tax=Phyllosticta citriasiana TaxID=595635 RepID=A0ABR1KD80_9PEZI
MGWTIALLGAFLLGVVSLLLFRPTRYSAAKNDTKRIQIVVLGDIGRSPRMQYHAMSLARLGYAVDIIGYKESDIHPALNSNDRVHVFPIPPWPRKWQTDDRRLFVLMAPLKVIWQTWGLFAAMSYETRPARFVLVQNPPSIPTLLVARVACILRNTAFCIDWHNFGHSILALKLGQSHPLVLISHFYEYAVTKNAPINFTVTAAMARVLREKHGRTGVIPLYDRPPAHFKPCASAAARREGLLSLARQQNWLIDFASSTPPKIIVSSTSWTPDEDFSLLLNALSSYSTSAQTTSLPPVIAIITGKGPQKELYLDKIANMEKDGQLTHVRILTAWLSIEDYARLLSYADLGVSLHTSSSGVDLPMKVVDMFGAGLPVAGWDRFEAWSELVQEGINGRGFGSAEALGELLVELLSDDGKQLQRLRKGAEKETQRRWDEEWEEKAGRVFG